MSRHRHRTYPVRYDCLPPVEIKAPRGQLLIWVKALKETRYRLRWGISARDVRNWDVRGCWFLHGEKPDLVRVLCRAPHGERLYVPSRFLDAAAKALRALQPPPGDCDRVGLQEALAMGFSSHFLWIYSGYSGIRHPREPRKHPQLKRPIRAGLELVDVDGRRVWRVWYSKQDLVALKNIPRPNPELWCPWSDVMREYGVRKSDLPHYMRNPTQRLDGERLRVEAFPVPEFSGRRRPSGRFVWREHLKRLAQRNPGPGERAYIDPADGSRWLTRFAAPKAFGIPYSQLWLWKNRPNPAWGNSMIRARPEEFPVSKGTNGPLWVYNEQDGLAVRRYMEARAKRGIQLHRDPADGSIYLKPCDTRRLLECAHTTLGRRRNTADPAWGNIVIHAKPVIPLSPAFNGNLGWGYSAEDVHAVCRYLSLPGLPAAVVSSISALGAARPSGEDGAAVSTDIPGAPAASAQSVATTQTEVPPALGQRFSIAWLRKKTGLQASKSINRWLKRAGVATPRPGKRNHLFTLAEVIRVLRRMATEASDQVADRSRNALERLREVDSK